MHPRLTRSDPKLFDQISYVLHSQHNSHSPNWIQGNWIGNGNEVTIGIPCPNSIPQNSIELNWTELRNNHDQIIILTLIWSWRLVFLPYRHGSFHPHPLPWPSSYHDHHPKPSSYITTSNTILPSLSLPTTRTARYTSLQSKVLENPGPRIGKNRKHFGENRKQ